MRFVRSLVAVGALGALAALAPRAAQAQADRDFENSWFWGVKGGLMQFWTADVSHAPAPSGGFDMLITRRKVALNLSYDMAFFDETATYAEYDLDGEPLGTQGRVRIENMRRYQASLLAFPARFGGLRPYGGIGVGINSIARTTPVTGDPTADTERSIEEARSRASAHFMVGLQGQWRRVSVFAQGTLMPARHRFVFSDAETIFVEGGIRYRIGSAREGR